MTAPPPPEVYKVSTVQVACDTPSPGPFTSAQLVNGVAQFTGLDCAGAFQIRAFGQSGAQVRLGITNPIVRPVQGAQDKTGIYTVQ